MMTGDSTVLLWNSENNPNPAVRVLVEYVWGNKMKEKQRHLILIEVTTNFYYKMKARWKNEF